MKTICIFGDSITYGAYDSQGGWAQRVKLREEKKGNSTYVLGIPGDTSTGLLHRFECEAAAREPDVIIIAIGINDSLYHKGGKAGTALNLFQENIQKLIQLAKRYVHQVIIMGLTNVDEARTGPIPGSEMGEYYSNEKIKKYDKVLSEIAKNEKVRFLPLFSTLTNSNLEDGLHPNDEGHRKICEEVERCLL